MKKQNIIMGIGFVLLFVMVIGVSYAAYKFSAAGTKGADTLTIVSHVSSFLFSVSSLFIRIVLRFNWVIVAFLSQSLQICYVVYYIGFIYYCQLVKSNNSHRT